MVPTARIRVSSSRMPTSSQTRAGVTDPERSTTRAPTLASIRHWGGSVSVVAIVMATAGDRFGAPRVALGLAPVGTGESVGVLRAVGIGGVTDGMPGGAGGGVLGV